MPPYGPVERRNLISAFRRWDLKDPTQVESISLWFAMR